MTDKIDRHAHALPGRPVKFWQLRLYVNGRTPRSISALANLKKICESAIKGRYRIKVIDLMEQPGLARCDQILAVPTVVRRLPKPMRIVIGDLPDADSVRIGLDMRAAV